MLLKTARRPGENPRTANYLRELRFIRGRWRKRCAGGGEGVGAGLLDATEQIKKQTKKKGKKTTPAQLISGGRRCKQDDVNKRLTEREAGGEGSGEGVGSRSDAVGADGGAAAVREEGVTP